MSTKTKTSKRNPLTQPQRGPMTSKVATLAGSVDAPRNHSHGPDTSVNVILFALTQTCAAADPPDFTEAEKALDVIFMNLPQVAVVRTERCDPKDVALGQMYNGRPVKEIITCALMRVGIPYTQEQIDHLVHAAESSLIVHFGLHRYASNSAAYGAFDNVAMTLVTYGTVLLTALSRQFATLGSKHEEVHKTFQGIKVELITIARENTEGPDRDIETFILETPLRMLRMKTCIRDHRAAFLDRYGPDCMDKAETAEDKVRPYEEQLRELFQPNKAESAPADAPAAAPASGGEPAPAAAPEPAGAPGPDTHPDEQDGFVCPEEEKIDWTAGPTDEELRR